MKVSWSQKLTDYTSGSIAYLIILTLGKLNHEFSNFVLNIHHFQNSRPIISDGDITIR